MSQRTTPPFRADHVGSLLRPLPLLRARADHAAGRISAVELRAVEDDAIREAVRWQEEVGLQAVTDGEFRRASWHMDFIYQLGGIHQAEERLHVRFRNAQGTLEFEPAALRVDGKVRLERTIFGDHLRFLQGITRHTPKLTIPSPSMVHYRGGRAALDPRVYPDEEAFWDDLSAAYADEIRRLAELGCTYLQLDDTSFAYLNDPRHRAMFDTRGENGSDQHLTYIRIINRALADRPAAMTVTVHMCRGNFRSSWGAEGGREPIALFIPRAMSMDVAAQKARAPAAHGHTREKS